MHVCISEEAVHVYIAFILCVFQGEDSRSHSVSSSVPSISESDNEAMAEEKMLRDQLWSLQQEK